MNRNLTLSKLFLVYRRRDAVGKLIDSLKNHVA